MKTVAFPPDREDVAGGLRVVFELLAQPSDVDIDRAFGDGRLVFPDLFENPLA